MSKLRPLLVLASWIALIFVLALSTSDAVLAPAPTPAQPDFIDTVLASRAAVAAIRISIVFAALFVALSVVALIAQRRWLTRLGPVEVSEELSGLDAENQRLKGKLAAAELTVEHLESHVAYSQQLVDKGDDA
jgi:hypothetical protein